MTFIEGDSYITEGDHIQLVFMSLLSGFKYSHSINDICAYII